MKRSLLPGVLAPSDLLRAAGGRDGDERLRVAGRIVANATGQLMLADAMSTVVLMLTTPTEEASVGDLVVVEAMRQGARLVDGSIVERVPYSLPSPDSDATRFVLGQAGGHVAARARALTAIR